MDVVKTKKKPYWQQHYRLIIAGALVSVVALTLIVFSSRDEVNVERSKLLLGTVQRGELKVVVDGYGVLRSQKQVLLTALTPATVQEIVLRPGAQVSEDSIILRLSNPELMQQVEIAQIALEQEKANLRRLVLTNQREILTEKSTLVELNAALQAATLRRDAEADLVDKGIIPQITYKSTLLQQEQAQKRFAFQQERINQLIKVVSESEMIQKRQIEQAEANFLSIQQRADRLIVRAGITGELQRLPVVLGQSVIAGQELALVGSDKDLVALIRVSQAKAEQLKIGQPVEINTRRETAAGEITRITPEVREGTIEVEVTFSEGVPASARPELNVDARIFTATLENSLFMERPINVQSNSKGSLFKLAKNNNFAERKELVFGEDSGRFIQVLSGATENDSFIISEVANLHNINRVHLVD